MIWDFNEEENSNEKDQESFSYYANNVLDKMIYGVNEVSKRENERLDLFEKKLDIIVRENHHICSEVDDE